MPAAVTLNPPAPAELASRSRDRAVLFALRGPQLGSVFRLATPSTAIGRDSGVDVRLEDATVSGLEIRSAGLEEAFLALTNADTANQAVA